MGRLLRLGVIFLALLLLASLLSLAAGRAEAGPLAAACLFVLSALAGLWFKGRRPGFTRAQRRRLFGYRGD